MKKITLLVLAALTALPVSASDRRRAPNDFERSASEIAAVLASPELLEKSATLGAVTSIEHKRPRPYADAQIVLTTMNCYIEASVSPKMVPYSTSGESIFNVEFTQTNCLQ